MRALVGPATFETAEETKRLLGIEVPRRRYRRPDRPDVSRLREELGI